MEDNRPIVSKTESFSKSCIVYIVYIVPSEQAHLTVIYKVFTILQLYLLFHTAVQHMLFGRSNPSMVSQTKAGNVIKGVYTRTKIVTTFYKDRA